MISARAMHTPSGIPLAMPFALQTISGSTLVCWIAHHFPVLPIPDCTSSAISRIPCLSQMLRISRKKWIRSDDVSPFTLNRLKNDRRNLLGWKYRLGTAAPRCSAHIRTHTPPVPLHCGTPR